MSFIDPSAESSGRFFRASEQQSMPLDTQAARDAYLLATENPLQCHVEVGVLRLNGEALETRLGKDEAYGAHRVGSVTKTFTSFLAMKLVNDGLISLGTKCSDLIDRKVLQAVFSDPDAAAEMTLEQLLSHTSGLEYDDHNRDEPGLNLPTMHARFLRESEAGNKYKHICQPGDGIGSYSNAGLAVAAWMMEVAYNSANGNEPPLISFSQIMRDELFSKVFDLSEDSYIEPGPSGDVIGAGAGDMTSSVNDLLKVAQHLQQGEEHLVQHFGAGWHQTMLAPRDLFAHHGLGCSANALSIQHAGLNYEIFEDGIGRDVTALVIFPLGQEQPGLVAMCDSNALGPLPNQVKFAGELKSLAGIENQAEHIDRYELDYYCPTSASAQVFKGDAYVVTDLDPFTTPLPDRFTLSRNGMKHELIRDTLIDAQDATGYRDANGKTWMLISKGERKMIYSDYCLVSAAPELRDAIVNPLAQPSKEQIQAVRGVYKDAENPDENPTYSFVERDGRLFFQEGNDKTYYPALFLPGENFWVVSLPSGRKNVKFRFPADPSEPLIIVDIAKKIENPSTSIADLDKLPPKHSVRKVAAVGPRDGVNHQPIRLDNEQSWMEFERIALPAYQSKVGKAYWKKHVVNGGKKDHGMLKNMLSQTSSDKDRTAADFDKAIATSDEALFCKLFEHLEFYQLYTIVGGEELSEIQTPNLRPNVGSISGADFSQQVERYLNERGFSGVVAISNGKEQFVVKSATIPEQNTPLCIHSVGKIGTGLLVLRLIEEGIINESDLSKPIQLDDAVMQALPESVQQRLKEVTFLDVMQHTSGLGDYLKGYQDAIQGAIDQDKPIPILTSAEGFIQFAEEKLYPVNEPHYSNLGLLLVGLSAQHHLSFSRGESISYEDALKEFVLDPANVGMFESTKPEGGVFNTDDQGAQYIRGGPAGGQWSTAEDILNLGKWVGEKSKEGQFAGLLDRYGGEFWNQGTLWHAGSIPSASAHLTHFGEQGLTVAVLSNTAGFCQATAVAETIQDRLIAEPLEI